MKISLLDKYINFLNPHFYLFERPKVGMPSLAHKFELLIQAYDPENSGEH